MPDARVAVDWASARRRRWSAARIAAALVLHTLVLLLLKLAIDRVVVPRRGEERSTTLVMITLHIAPPLAPHESPPLPRHPGATVGQARMARTTRPPALAAPARQAEDRARTITLPAPPHDEPSPPLATATPPASSPRPDLSFLNNDATRRAIRAVARGDTLASHANALTHEEDGSELVAADGTHAGLQRNLPPPPPAQLLAKQIAAAHKGDCAKGEYAGGGMGLLSAPFLLAAEAMGQCSSK